MATLKIFTDGGARGNPGPAASACVIFDNSDLVAQASKYLGETTNNDAEYRAVLLALDTLDDKFSEDKQNLDLHFNLDSLLVVNQLSGKFKIKNQNLQGLAGQIKKRLQEYKSADFNYVPRAKNHLADKLVNSCLDKH